MKETKRFLAEEARKEEEEERGGEFIMAEVRGE